MRIIVKWLEWLSYGLENRCNVVSSRLGFAVRRLENSVSAAINGYLFRIGGGVGGGRGEDKVVKGEGWAQPFIS